MPVLPLLLLIACGEPAAPPPAPEVTDTPAAPRIHVDRSDGAWGPLACDYLGLRALEGRFVVDPPAGVNHLGEHFRGEWLIEDSGARWVVSYAPRADYARFAGEQVVVRGRPCSKRGPDSIPAQHFDIERIALRADLQPHELDR